jgi:hypothetical protein
MRQRLHALRHHLLKASEHRRRRVHLHLSKRLLPDQRLDLLKDNNPNHREHAGLLVLRWLHALGHHLLAPGFHWRNAELLLPRGWNALRNLVYVYRDNDQ